MTATSPRGAESSVYGLRAAGGAYEQFPYETTTYLLNAGVAAKVGEKGRTVYGGAHPLNVTTSSP